MIVGSECSIAVITDVTLGALHAQRFFISDVENLQREQRRISIGFILKSYTDANMLTCTFAGERCFLFFFLGQIIKSLTAFLSFFISTCDSDDFSSCLMLNYKKEIGASFSKARDLLKSSVTHPEAHGGQAGAVGRVEGNHPM